MAGSFSEHGIVVPAGADGEVDTLCPECSSTRTKRTHKCLSVNVSKGTWLCHHCGWEGGLGNREQWQANRIETKRYVRPTYKRADYDTPSELAEWFKKRGISVFTLISENISLFNGWIRFPFYRNGEVINIKSRKLASKEFRQEADCERILYGMVNPPHGETHHKLLWVEGEIDRLSLLEAGYKYVVSVPDGAPPPGSKHNRSKFEFLQSCEPYIKMFASHVLAVDNDAPGEGLLQELARRIGPEKCLRVEWPDKDEVKGEDRVKCKDANEVLTNGGGAKALKELIERARYLPVEGLFEVRDIMPDAARLYDDGVSRGVSTGFPSLDQYMTIKPGQLCIITGIPSSGKSSFIDDMMVRLAVNEDYRCGVFSPENAPLAQHFKKLAELFIGKAYFPGAHLRMTPNEVIKAGRFLQDHFYFITPQEEAMNIDDILAKAKLLVYRHGINFLVVDPYNDIDQDYSDGTNESLHASRLLSKCQRFARVHQIFFALVAHPTKLRKDDRTGQYPVPTPYDISGSAHFRNRGDICCAGHRPDLTKDVMEWHVQKVRFKEVGKPGMVKFAYQQNSGRFEPYMGGYSKRSPAMEKRDVDAINAELEEARRGGEEPE